MNTDAIAAELADAAVAAQRTHVFAAPTACSCGYEPVDLADWERHRLMIALSAFTTALAGATPIGALIAASSLGAALAEVESQDPDAVMSDGERGYQQAIDHLRDGDAYAGWATRRRHVDDWQPTAVTDTLRQILAAYLEARRGDEEHRPAARTFALPSIPEDVKAVRDAEGMIWYREDGAALTAAGVTDLWWNTDDDYCNAAELLTAGDLTEILPGEFEEPEVLEDNRG